MDSIDRLKLLVVHGPGRLKKLVDWKVGCAAEKKSPGERAVGGEALEQLVPTQVVEVG